MTRMVMIAACLSLAALSAAAAAGSSPPRSAPQDPCAQATAANVLVALTDAGLIDQTRVDPSHLRASLLAQQVLDHHHQRRIYRLQMDEGPGAGASRRSVTVIAVSEASPEECPWRDPPFYVVSRSLD